ncbi:AraC family transcriptional regulator [Pedobacter sp. HDW13]|uniref:AraC family transcriptional regulator n=1 Tax=unclassified Pedobacter TaxID=2628915 RepID=UPI000F5ACEBA|nr:MULTISPECIES: AraC family transcriptional regulator [unclassified Pedobacter]QIL40534.1 AraC family transcriptional regulator [Pedobacter sp. HDW13]RQO66548.1 AraC family transcriptional regulator [Pedobacter sp. KBW01]
MQPFTQRLLPDESSSFIAKTFRTPNFEVGWHQHIEYELILFTEGSGMSFVGNHIGEFETGDIYLIGANLPHTFQKTGDQVTSAIVVQFREDFWGTSFIHLPENRVIKALFEASMLGLKIKAVIKNQLASIIKELEYANGVKRIVLLLESLFLIANQREYISVSTQQAKAYDQKGMDIMGKVFQFTIDSFREQITLSDVAKKACMSIPAFCKNFKRSTKKTYNDFLNEVRIEYACSQLIETNKSIFDICYESGYSTHANFHKQFQKIKNISPLQYRKSFTLDNISKGGKIGIVETI